MAKTDIHPKYYQVAKVHCVCGNVFTVGSTQEDLRVEICYKCHPLYTGEEKLIDTAGRLERFKNRAMKATPKVVKKVRLKKAPTSA